MVPERVCKVGRWILLKDTILACQILMAACCEEEVEGRLTKRKYCTTHASCDGNEHYFRQQMLCAGGDKPWCPTVFTEVTNFLLYSCEHYPLVCGFAFARRSTYYFWGHCKEADSVGAGRCAEEIKVFPQVNGVKLPFFHRTCRCTIDGCVYCLLYSVMGCADSGAAWGGNWDVESQM